MAKVKPFRAIRPKHGLEEKIAALPYDVYNTDEAKREVEREPLSFLRIDRAETQFGEDVDIYADCVYQKAHDLLWDMVAKGEFIREERDSYYVYELIMNGRSQTGITACASVEDYLHDVIKKHENTRADKEADRIRHVDICDAQTGPIFLAYRAHPVLREEMNRVKQTMPLYDFTSHDNITHRVWRIDEEAAVERIRDAFTQVDSIYIADGHHRCASAVKVSMKRREEFPDYTGEEEFHYFLSVFFPDDELMIMDYNRVVKDLNGYREEELLAHAGRIFKCTDCGTKPFHPENKGTFGMYLKDRWYRLEVREDTALGENPVERLDVAILQNRFLSPILGITDPKTDDRIDFIGGIRGMEELEKRVQTDCAVAFAMYPTSIRELFEVSDAGLLMPPKSTWFEPKLRSGLFIHSIIS